MSELPFGGAGRRVGNLYFLQQALDLRSAQYLQEHGKRLQDAVS